MEVRGTSSVHVALRLLAAWVALDALLVAVWIGRGLTDGLRWRASRQQFGFDLTVVLGAVLILASFLTVSPDGRNAVRPLAQSAVNLLRAVESPGGAERAGAASSSLSTNSAASTPSVSLTPGPTLGATLPVPTSVTEPPSPHPLVGIVGTPSGSATPSPCPSATPSPSPSPAPAEDSPSPSAAPSCDSSTPSPSPSPADIGKEPPSAADA